MLRNLIKSSFLWQFTGGFVLGALGLLAFQPAEATQPVYGAPVHTAPAQR